MCLPWVRQHPPLKESDKFSLTHTFTQSGERWRERLMPSGPSISLYLILCVETVELNWSICCVYLSVIMGCKRENVPAETWPVHPSSCSVDNSYTELSELLHSWATWKHLMLCFYTMFRHKHNKTATLKLKTCSSFFIQETNQQSIRESMKDSTKAKIIKHINK